MPTAGEGRTRKEAQRRQGEKKNKYGACAVKKKEKMQFRFYAIPIAGDKTVEDELNAFVRSHKIIGCFRPVLV